MMQGLSEEYYRNYLEHILECDDCWKIYLSSLQIINKHLEQKTKEKEGTTE